MSIILLNALKSRSKSSFTYQLNDKKHSYKEQIDILKFHIFRNKMNVLEYVVVIYRNSNTNNILLFNVKKFGFPKFIV